MLQLGTAPLGAPLVLNEQRDSSKVFGAKSSKANLESSEDEDDEAPASPCPVFKRHGGHVRSGSIASALGNKRVGRSPLKSMPIAPEARRGLGLTGTMGSLTEPSIDPEDPDSDIPDELQVIIAGQSDDESIRNLNDTLSFHRPSEPSFHPRRCSY